MDSKNNGLIPSKKKKVTSVSSKTNYVNGPNSGSYSTKKNTSYHYKTTRKVNSSLDVINNTTSSVKGLVDLDSKVGGVSKALGVDTTYFFYEVPTADGDSVIQYQRNEKGEKINEETHIRN